MMSMTVVLGAPGRDVSDQGDEIYKGRMLEFRL